jgi:hypothetical protein
MSIELIKARVSKAGLIGTKYFAVGDTVEVPEDRIKTLEKRGVLNGAVGTPTKTKAKQAKPKSDKK